MRVMSLLVLSTACAVSREEQVPHPRASASVRNDMDSKVWVLRYTPIFDSSASSPIDSESGGAANEKKCARAYPGRFSHFLSPG